MAAELFIFQNLIVQGDAASTSNNIIANELLFRTGICFLLIVIVCDIVVAWALYVFLKPVNQSLSLLTAWFRLVYSVIFGVAVINYFNILQFLNGSDYLTAIEPAQLHAQVMFSIKAFNDGWAVGFVFFGLHLVLLGYLGFKSGYVPKTLGILLVIAGIGYLVYNLGKFLLLDYDLMIVTAAGWGELIFAFWLLFRGGKLSN
jgi:hypothetical protein